jgi:hypothetical protein
MSSARSADAARRAIGSVGGITPPMRPSRALLRPVLRAVLLAVLLAGVSGAGCATTSSAGSGSGLRAREFFPLAVGNRWEYRITPAPSDKPTDQVEIVERDDKGYFIDSRGGRLAPRTDGVFDGERFLLQEPVELGHEWIAVPRPNALEKYKIVGVGTTTKVPAGTFDGCVEVEASQEMRHPETGQRAVVTMTWSYAPGVGLVKAVGRVIPENHPPQVTTTMELVSYDVKPQG